MSSSISYRDAGVDIDTGDRLVERIKPFVKRTQTPYVLGGLGGFGGLLELPVEKYRRPVLVSGTDGVGTKLKLAMQWNGHDDIGVDLVAMCVNDIVVTGAEPLFFLDYYATGKLNDVLAARVIAGIARGCEQAGCALIGGETAEMPGMYSGEDYDLAGFAVGVVEKDQIISSDRVQVGDVLLGLASSGVHSNGYSLVRKIIEVRQLDPSQIDLDGRKLSSALLTPTRIYVKSLLSLIAGCEVHGLAHITGGGITDNLPRVLPDNCEAHISLSSWEKPAVFAWLREQGQLDDAEMLRTFNSGLGMIVVVPAAAASLASQILREAGEQVFEIGSVQAGQGAPRVVYQA